MPSSRKRSSAQVPEEELRQEKIKAASRASGLKKSLVELNDFSNATMRRLDDSYYSVLEKVGMLQNTILAMKELAGMATETDRQFKQESEDLVKDISGQLDALGGFEEQAERIETLTRRIHNGRDKVKALGERVEAVREKIERWETADREWQERTRRRLKAIWVFTSVLVLVVVMLVIVAQYVSVGGEATAGHYPGMEESSGRGNSKGFLAEALNRSTQHPIDETLRVFDEL
jgi:chromosome segregation ATPase